MTLFPVSCLKHTLESYSVWRWGTIKSNATQQLIQMHRADCRRCFQQRKRLCNKLIQVDVLLFRRDQYIMKVTSVLLVPLHQSGTFWSGLFKMIWIFNHTYGGPVFILSTFLTWYSISRLRRRCVRLQWWAEKRGFPSLRALDYLWVGQQFLIFDFFEKI